MNWQPWLTAVTAMSVPVLAVVGTVWGKRLTRRTDDVREDAKYADGGDDVSANPVGGLGRDTGSASEGGPGTEGGLGSD